MADEAIAPSRIAPRRSNADFPSYRERACGEAVTRICWFLLLLFILLQIADVITTNYALAVPGIREVNPLMTWTQARLGPAWWLPKVAVVGFVCLATPLLQRRWPMLLVVAYYSIIVSINIAHL
jgi:Domain of unknown function (DUF5658)